MKKFFSLLLKLGILIILIILTDITLVKSKTNIEQKKIIRAAVLLYKEDDDYINKIKENLKNIQSEDKNNMQCSFYDAKSNQDIQNKQIEEVLDEKVDIIFLNIADIKSTEKVINKIKANNVPVILFNREPTSLNSIRSYGKALFIGSDGREAGILQGEIVKKIWSDKKITMDKNRDNILQYVMIKGEKENLESKYRSEYSIKSINDYGIKTYEITSEYCNWNKECAKDIVKLLLMQYGNSIEAIICNNDSMAEGSVMALQESGYNSGDEKNSIAVIGVDGSDKALELIKDKYMVGTVVQDAYEMSKAIYVIGKNMADGKYPLENTKYKFDSTGVTVRIPYSNYIINED